MKTTAVLLDVDGTLINSNEAHSRAWVDVGREAGFQIHYEDIRPLIGMGSDKVLPKLTGLEIDSPEGERLAKRHGEIYRERYLPHLRVFHGTHAMLERMGDAGLTLVIATSAGKEDLRAMLEHAKLAHLVDDKTSSSDVEASKPDPDIVQAALKKAKVGADQAIFLGDTPYDIEASTRELRLAGGGPW